MPLFLCLVRTEKISGPTSSSGHTAGSIGGTASPRLLPAIFPFRGRHAAPIRLVGMRVVPRATPHDALHSLRPNPTIKERNGRVIPPITGVGHGDLDLNRNPGYHINCTSQGHC